MLRNINKKIVKIIKVGLTIIIICIGFIITINNGYVYAKDINAAEFKLQENVIDASEFKLQDNIVNASEFKCR